MCFREMDFVDRPLETIIGTLCILWTLFKKPLWSVILTKNNIVIEGSTKKSKIKYIKRRKKDKMHKWKVP